MGLQESEQAHVKDLFLLTDKPVLYVCNANETDVKNPSQRVRTVEGLAAKEKAQVVTICGGIEAELADLSDEEKKDFWPIWG